jgi:hypothetical protein
MNKIAVALLACLAAIGGCASLYRPPATANYYCVNTDVNFTVSYTWDPPRARLTLENEPPIELSPTPDNPLPRGHYAFGAVGGAQLEVMPDHVYLHRPGQRALRCEEEVIVVT